MKKGFLLILWCLYLFSVSGMKVAVHYCHGHFQTLTFNANTDEDACCKKRPMKKRGCCNDKVIEVKVKSDHKISTVVAPAFNPNIASASVIQTPTYNALYSEDVKVFSPYSPPRGKPISVQIMNSTFRI
jgi:hypothetical protein